MCVGGGGSLMARSGGKSNQHQKCFPHINLSLWSSFQEYAMLRDKVRDYVE